MALDGQIGLWGIPIIPQFIWPHFFLPSVFLIHSTSFPFRGGEKTLKAPQAVIGSAWLVHNVALYQSKHISSFQIFPR